MGIKLIRLLAILKFDYSHKIWMLWKDRLDVKVN